MSKANRSQTQHSRHNQQHDGRVENGVEQPRHALEYLPLKGGEPAPDLIGGRRAKRGGWGSTDAAHDDGRADPHPNPPPFRGRERTESAANVRSQSQHAFEAAPARAGRTPPFRGDILVHLIYRSLANETARGEQPWSGQAWIDEAASDAVEADRDSRGPSDHAATNRRLRESGLRKIVTALGYPRHCGETACRRTKRCAGPDFRCQRDFPPAPFTNDERQKVLAQFKRDIAERRAQIAHDEQRVLSPRLSNAAPRVIRARPRADG